MSWDERLEKIKEIGNKLDMLEKTCSDLDLREATIYDPILAKIVVAYGELNNLEAG